jgi:hypothetical protein
MNMAGLPLSVLECSNCTLSLSYGNGPCWAAKSAEELCSGSCGTHGDCAKYGTSCLHCGDCETSCECDVCGNCGQLSDECSCCGNCGSSHCDSCDDCGESSCECSCESEYEDSYSSGGGGSYGSIRVAPWVERGIVVKQVNRSSSNSAIAALWGIDTSIDLCQSAADKYLLAGIADGVANMSQPDAYLSLLRTEAAAMLTDLTARLDSTFRGYLDAIIGGELRHHRAAGSTNLRHTSRKQAWSEWHAIREAGGSAVLQDAVDLFRDFHSSSYGGDAWAAIAQARLDRETGKLSPKLFVEMCWMLQHNGGSLFDKGQWSVQNRMGWSFYELNTWVLPAHGAERNPWTVLLAVCSDAVRDLFAEYWRQANRVLVSWGERAVRLPEMRVPSTQDYWGARIPDYEGATAAGMIGIVHV